MTYTVLRRYDPAFDVDPDPASPPAQALLERIVAEPRAAKHHHPIRLALVSGGLVAAAIVTAIALDTGGTDQPRIGPAGFVVTRHDDGSVTATVRWSALSDPDALQRALDEAGARTKVFVETDTGSGCTNDNQSVPYSADAVEWSGPDDSDPDSGLVVHPAKFPSDGTFVVVVTLAGQSGLSTLAPSFPQITGSLTFMADGPVTPPTC